MFKKIIFVLLLCSLFAVPAAAAGGAGTAANPYVIQTPAELQSITNNLAAYYVLGNDIDLQGYSFTPIGSTSAPFRGQLDGNGYTIKNLALSSTAQSAGLFSSLTSGATIKDLSLTDCHVTSTSSWCGCLVGSITMSSSAHETATLQNIDMVRCSATSSKDNVGVLCGIYMEAVVDITDCTLINCEAESTGSYNVGVLCGACSIGTRAEITGCTVTTSHASAGGSDVGILCGGCGSRSTLIMTDCNVDTCIAESTVSYAVGLLCGFSSGGGRVYAENCVAENSIAKAITTSAGGLFGHVDGTGTSIGATGCKVKKCTVVTTRDYAGGIAGRVVSGSTGVFDSCTVTGCTILATSYAATICPGFS